MGGGMAQRIEAMSGGAFAVQQGTLYPALQRMTRRGWVRSEWRQTENNRSARYYESTASGLAQFEKERDQGARTTAAIDGILNWVRGVV